MESFSSFGAALDADVADILQDVHASGSEIQGHLPGAEESTTQIPENLMPKNCVLT